jgi:hypothetical protein
MYRAIATGRFCIEGSSLHIENLNLDLPNHLRHRQEATVGLRAGEIGIA